MEGGKKRLDGYFSEDRISALPDSLVDCILDCLSLHDVVRTSVLSTRWRHCWTRVRKLVFDLDFFEKYIETGNSAVGSVIESILSRLDGPIHEFCLDVVLDMTRKVSQPVMDTSHALRLDVSRWIPLLLEDEDVDDDYADDDKLYVIHAPQLESLLIYSARRTFYLIKCPSLTLADLCTKLEVPMVDRLQTTKLDSFVLGMPKVETLVLRGAALTSLAVGGVPTTLTTRFQNLKDLDLYYIDVLSTAQLSSAFCIIRSLRYL
uniref:F-box domain-containing protein n=1 Tax=Kalanchoe fedtschenkoi TaxID=63787 RepID=A0A7N0VHC6_KALFE